MCKDENTGMIQNQVTAYYKQQQGLQRLKIKNMHYITMQVINSQRSSLPKGTAKIYSTKHN